MEIIQEFKIIWEYLGKYKKEVRKLMFLAVAASLLIAAIPYIYGRLVDLVLIQATDTIFIFALLGIWFLMSIVSVCMRKFIRLKGNFLSVDMVNDLIYESSKHIMELPLSFHKEKKIGSIFSKIERAAIYLGAIIQNIVFWFLPELLTVFAGIFILFFIEWKLAISIIFLFSGFVLITLYKTIPIIESQKKLNKIAEIVSGNLCDSFLNIQTIKSCAVEDFQKQKTKKDYYQKLGPVYRDFFRAWTSLSLYQEIFFAIGFVSVFGFAILLLKDSLITPGKLVMFLGYLTILRLPLMSLAWSWQEFRTGITAIKRIRDLMKVKTENYNLNGIVLKEPKGKVEFKDINFGYKKDRIILTDINFIAEIGQKIAIVGGSGEGKTTLVDLISLYFIPTKGKILVDNIDSKKLNLQFLRKIIAYVPQEIILFNDTIENNIRYGKPKATEEEIFSATKAANAHNFIKTFPKKYKQIVGERGIKLSAGQKQRLAIARALIRDPKILILDEATSSLDAESEKLVQDALEKLIQNRTTFIIAHRLSTVVSADKILVLEKGRIVEQGTHEELIKKHGNYYRLASLQLQLGE